MTLDDPYFNQREMARRDREADWAEQKHERDLLDDAESIEAEESKWAGIFARGSRREPVYYHDGRDPRLFGP